jgi:hypothetical protein
MRSRRSSSNAAAQSSMAFSKLMDTRDHLPTKPTTGALETALIPSAQNSQLKSLLQSGLALFEQS